MSHQVIETPWIVIAVDVMRPWNKAEFAYILMIQDLFAKWVECRTLQVNGKSIKEALKDLILSRWGMRFLLTDNSTEFMNKTLLSQETDIMHTTVPSYHPQTPVERVNRILKTIIIFFLDRDYREGCALK